MSVDWGARRGKFTPNLGLSLYVSLSQMYGVGVEAINEHHVQINPRDRRLRRTSGVCWSNGGPSRVKLEESSLQGLQSIILMRRGAR